MPTRYFKRVCPRCSPEIRAYGVRATRSGRPAACGPGHRSYSFEIRAARTGRVYDNSYPFRSRSLGPAAPEFRTRSDWRKYLKSPVNLRGEPMTTYTGRLATLDIE